MILKVSISSLSQKRSRKHGLPLLFFLILNASINCIAQDSRENIPYKNRIGMSIGHAQQRTFPFNDNDYSHKTRSIKIHWSRNVWNKKRWSLDLALEPTVYWVDHQLLNLFFIKPSTPNYQTQRTLFTQKQSYQEYALSIGISMNYHIDYHWAAYGLLSIGPMTATQSTERQVKGFAFSDVLGLGPRYQLKHWGIDLRMSIRHVSNAQLQLPNNGHNTAGIDLGVFYRY